MGRGKENTGSNSKSNGIISGLKSFFSSPQSSSSSSSSTSIYHSTKSSSSLYSKPVANVNPLRKTSLGNEDRGLPKSRSSAHIQGAHWYPNNGNTAAGLNHKRSSIGSNFAAVQFAGKNLGDPPTTATESLFSYHPDKRNKSEDNFYEGGLLFNGKPLEKSKLSAESVVTAQPTSTSMLNGMEKINKDGVNTYVYINPQLQPTIGVSGLYGKSPSNEKFKVKSTPSFQDELKRIQLRKTNQGLFDSPKEVNDDDYAERRKSDIEVKPMDEESNCIQEVPNDFERIIAPIPMPRPSLLRKHISANVSPKKPIPLPRQNKRKAAAAAVHAGKDSCEIGKDLAREDFDGSWEHLEVSPPLPKQPPPPKAHYVVSPEHRLV